MREAILQATSAILAQRGGRPTLDEIAAIAGVTTRTVRDYFSSSTAIEDELIAHLDPATPANYTQ